MATVFELPWQEMSSFLLSCGSIHEPTSFCKAVLDEIVELIPYDEGVFFMFDGNRRIINKRFKNIPRRFSALYLDYFSRISDLDFGLDRDVSELQNGGYTRVIDWEKYFWNDDDFMVDYIRPRYLKYSLVFTFFDLNGSPATAFSLDRTSDRNFSHHDRRIAEELVAHLNNLYKNMFVRPKGQVRLWDGHGAAELTPREREVTELLCEGVTPANIARDLRISVGTTNKHISHIYKKFDVDCRQELLVLLLGK